MQVYVLVGVWGEDPPDVQVLGVYQSEDRALQRKEEIDAHTTAYLKQCMEVGDEVIRLLNQWKDRLPKRFPHNTQAEWTPWQQLHDMIRMYGVRGSAISAVTKYRLARTEFINNLQTLCERVALSVRMPPLPEFPQAVEWEHSHPPLLHYEMSISQCDFD